MIGVAGLFADVPVAHAQTFLTPSGGITIKDLAIRNDGWAIVTFAESLPELSSCGTWSTGSVSYNQFMFIDLVNTSTGRQLYASVLAASLAGRKLVSVGVNI